MTANSPSYSITLGISHVAAALPSATPLVATQPQHLMTAMSTLDAFRFVIAAANDTLRIASPFIEENGVRLLLPWLRAAADRGVSLTLVSRGLGGSPSAPAAEEMLRLTFGSRLRTATYHVTSENRQLLSLHAKLLIADSTFAYVGSADVRRHALELNFELGVLVSAEPAADLARMFDAIAALSPG